jgi:flagellar hook assembly protein FlgD
MPNNDIELQVKVASGGVDVYDTHIVWLSASSKQVFTGSAQIETANEIPQDFALTQNHPNPFNPETQITFALPEASTVRLTVFDVLGREVAVLEDRILPAGYRTVRWNGRNSKGESVGSGVYFYRITAVGESGRIFAQTAKMALMK